MNEEIKVEDAIAVLNDQPTINERLDKLEKMMEQILLRLPIYSTSGYSAPVWTSSGATITTTTTTGATYPYTVTTADSTIGSYYITGSTT